MTVSAIIDRFGGLSEFASSVGVPVTTAFYWKSKNFIPEWRQREVLESAFGLKLDISAADFPDKAAA